MGKKVNITNPKCRRIAINTTNCKCPTLHHTVLQAIEGECYEKNATIGSMGWTYTLNSPENNTLPPCVPYCSSTDLPARPANSVQTSTLSLNHPSQTVNWTCNAGYEFIELMEAANAEFGGTAAANDSTPSNVTAKFLNTTCDIRPDGGAAWRYDYKVPSSCLKIECLDPLPHLNASAPTDIVHNWDNQTVTYLTNVRYNCQTFGKRFRKPNKSFYSHLLVTCQSTKVWSHLTIPDQCEWAHCISPPVPPDEHNLKLQFNPTAPPAIGTWITYTCDAGLHNKYETDFNMSTYRLQCLEDNQFDIPAWPTCVNITYCPDPETLTRTPDIVLAEDYGVRAFQQKVEWRCDDERYKIAEQSDSVGADMIVAECTWYKVKVVFNFKKRLSSLAEWHHHPFNGHFLFQRSLFNPFTFSPV